jgi:hypothetical protein
MKLSGVVQEIADVIGRERALYLIGKLPRCYSGPDGKASWRVILYVPTIQRLTAKHQLVEILGMQDAQKLCRHFGGEILQPGNCYEIYKRFRDASIARLAAQGLQQQTLEVIFDMSTRHIRTIRNSVTQAANPQEGIKAANDNNARTITKARANEPKRRNSGANR